MTTTLKIHDLTRHFALNQVTNINFLVTHIEERKEEPRYIVHGQEILIPDEEKTIDLSKYIMETDKIELCEHVASASYDEDYDISRDLKSLNLFISSKNKARIKVNINELVKDIIEGRLR